MDDENSRLVLLLASAYWVKQRKKKRKHRWWIHRVIGCRKQHGTYYHLIQELEADSSLFQQYFRLTKVQFETVFAAVGPKLTRVTKAREPICPKQRLAVCLR